MRHFAIVTLFCAASIAGTALSQPATFGNVFPVANTRYQPAAAHHPLLRTNGRELFLFWSSTSGIRATKVRDGETRLGHVVASGYPFDVVWNGTHFLVFSTRGGDPWSWSIVMTTLDADAKPVGPEVLVVENASSPSVAVSGSSILLCYYRYPSEWRAEILTSQGTRSGWAKSFPIPTRNLVAASNGFRFVIARAQDDGVDALMIDRQGLTISERSIGRPHEQGPHRRVTVASNGTGFLLVWNEGNHVGAATFDEHRGLGAPLVVDDAAHTGLQPSAATWNGDGWTIAYATSYDYRFTVRVVQIDHDAQAALSREESESGFDTPTLASLDGRTRCAWGRANWFPDSVLVSDLPLAANPVREASYAATEQVLLRAVSTDDATLILWSETGDGRTRTHAGVRSSAGDWQEHELPPLDTRKAVAAGDDQFLVSAHRDDHVEVFLFDESGRMKTTTSTLQFSYAATWDGRRYAMIGWDGAAFQAVLLSSDGREAAPRVEIADPASGGFSIASNGEGFLVTHTRYCDGCGGFRAIRLGPDLQHIESGDLDLVAPGTTVTNVGLVWDGSQYITAWTEWDERTGERTANRLARIPAAAGAPAAITPLEPDLIYGRLTRSAAGAILTFTAKNAAGEPVSRIAFLRSDGTIARTIDLDRGATLTSSPHVAAHPDGNLVYVASSIQRGEPHHGTSHVMMAIGNPTSNLPGAPRVIAQFDKDETIVAQWSAAAGTINGYRLEYRIDDGAWNELEPWFSPGEHRVEIRRPPYGARFAFRVRAFNDAGAGPYSAVAHVNPGRRRSAR